MNSHPNLIKEKKCINIGFLRQIIKKHFECYDLTYSRCLIQCLKGVTFPLSLKTSDSSVVSSCGTTSEIVAILNPNFYNYKIVAEKSCKLHITNHAQSQTLSGFFVCFNSTNFALFLALELI